MRGVRPGARAVVPAVRPSKPEESILATHAIIAYSLHLEDRYKRGEKQRHFLAPMPNGQGDMLMAVSAFIESFHGTLGSHRDNHFGEVTSIQREGRTIGATMVAGRGGLQSDISDPAREADEGVFRRERRHIEKIPVRQMVVIPRESQTGYWLFESVGGRSLGAAYQAQFNRDFTARFRNLGPVFERVVSSELWDAYEENEDAKVEQLRIVHARAEKDRANRLGLGNVPGRYIELIDTSEIPQPAKLLRAIRRKLYRRGDGGRLEPKDPELTEVSATIRYGDVERTVTIDHEHELGMRLVLETSGDDPPSDSFFYSEARRWVEELAERDDVKLPADWRGGSWEHDPNFGELGAGDGSSGTSGSSPVADE